VKSLIYEESGQDLVEYAFLLAFIALVCVLGMQQLGTAINATYMSVNTSLAAAGS
jgi:Flp pilus assembly pilin Flp